MVFLYMLTKIMARTVFLIINQAARGELLSQLVQSKMPMGIARYREILE